MLQSVIPYLQLCILVALHLYLLGFRPILPHVRWRSSSKILGIVQGRTSRPVYNEEYKGLVKASFWVSLGTPFGTALTQLLQKGQ